jgi:hypothetical protein
VLFAGDSPVSRLIRLASGGDWSHVAMVLRLPTIFPGVLLWESTTLSDIPDLESRLPTRGVQLVPMSQRLASYHGRVAVRRLTPRPTPAMVHALARRRAQLSRRAYEQHRLQLLRAAYDGLGGNNREDLSTVFCSELVAEAYQAMALLPEPPAGRPSNEYTPVDFARPSLRLKHSRRLSPPIHLIG